MSIFHNCEQAVLFLLRLVIHQAFDDSHKMPHDYSLSQVVRERLCISMDCERPYSLMSPLVDCLVSKVGGRWMFRNSE